MPGKKPVGPKPIRIPEVRIPHTRVQREAIPKHYAPGGKTFFTETARRYVKPGPAVLRVPSNFHQPQRILEKFPKPTGAAPKSGQAKIIPITQIEAKSNAIAELEAAFATIRFFVEFAGGPKPEFFKPWERSIQEFASSYRRIHQGTVILDTSVRGKAHEHLRVVDHHGIYLTQDGKNTTLKLLDLFESTLKNVQKDWIAQLDAVRAMEQDPHLADAARHDPVVAAAIIKLNIKRATTDNLADGAEAVWVTQNQGEVLHQMKDGGKLPQMLREATDFIDFKAFGNNYDRKNPSVELGAALLYQYGKILKKNNIKGSDRFAPELAESILGDATGEIDLMIRDPQTRKEAAESFWKEVDAAKSYVKKASVLKHQANGKDVIEFYDASKWFEFSVFGQWLAVPEIQRNKARDEKLQIQVTLAPMPEAQLPGGNTAPRSLPIVAIPNGLQSPNPKGLLGAVEAINAAEAKKAKGLGLSPNFWFGKDNVILANPAGGGSLLTPQEILKVLKDPAHNLLWIEQSLDLRNEIPAGSSVKIGEITLRHGDKTGFWIEINPGTTIHFKDSMTGKWEEKSRKEGDEPFTSYTFPINHGDVLELPQGIRLELIDSKHGPAIEARRKKHSKK